VQGGASDHFEKKKLFFEKSFLKNRLKIFPVLGPSLVKIIVGKTKLGRARLGQDLG
jgi:hypothetical protein